MSNSVLIFVTCASRAEAEQIAQRLLEARLAACVNIISGVTSFFHWQGNIDRAEEHLLIIKTQQALFDELAATVKERHSYQTPEIIALPIVAGAADYLAWIAEETQR